MRARLSILAGCLIIVGVIGWVDLVTGPDLGLSLLYLMPVACSAWFCGIWATAIVASAAGGAWFSADVAFRTTESAVLISVWNSFTRLVIYESEGIFIALLKRDREILKGVVVRESELARTDSKTSLANARAFAEAAEIELRLAREHGRPISVLYIDLDHFKAVNDQFGHEAGDRALTEVASAVMGSIRSSDTAARLGGDEFAVLLREGEELAVRAIAERIRERIGEIAKAYPGTGLGATIGAVMWRNPPDDHLTLIREADHAMYRGKAAGRGNVFLQQM